MSIPRVVERPHYLVLHDSRLMQLGVRGLAVVAFQEIAGRELAADEIRVVIKEFWEYWHLRHHKPRAKSLIGGPRGRRFEEVSAAQENAIRAWEDVPA